MNDSQGRSGTALTLIIALMAVGLGVVAVVLFAQLSKTEGHVPPPLPESADQVSDEQLRAFAQIFGEVADIQAILKSEMLEATSQQAVGQAEQRAQEQMIDAVRRNGMEVEKYNRIAELLNDDSELYDRYRRIQQEATLGTDRGE